MIPQNTTIPKKTNEDDEDIDYTAKDFDWGYFDDEEIIITDDNPFKGF